MNERKSEHSIVEILEDSQAIIEKIAEIDKKTEKYEKWQRIGIRVLGYGMLAAMLVADAMGFFRMMCGYMQ